MGCEVYLALPCLSHEQISLCVLIVGDKKYCCQVSRKGRVEAEISWHEENVWVDVTRVVGQSRSPCGLARRYGSHQSTGSGIAERQCQSVLPVCSDYPHNPQARRYMINGKSSTFLGPKTASLKILIKSLCGVKNSGINVWTRFIASIRITVVLIDRSGG